MAVTLHDDVKLALRISNVAYDSEVQDLIDAAKMDMELVGIVTTSIVDTDILIKRAIITYVKAHFGLGNPDAEKLQQSYEMIRNHLSQNMEHNGGVVIV